MAATQETISVDGGGDQRQEATGDEEDDLETQGGRAGWARAKGLGEISKIWPVDIYNLTLSVWPSGTTRMHNCKQLQQLGVTEKFKSVAPRLKTLDQLSDSVGPKGLNRSDRDS